MAILSGDQASFEWVERPKSRAEELVTVHDTVILETEVDGMKGALAETEDSQRAVLHPTMMTHATSTVARAVFDGSFDDSVVNQAPRRRRLLWHPHPRCRLHRSAASCTALDHAESLQKMHNHHHITSSLCCLTCPLSRVSWPAPTTSPRHPDSDKLFFSLRWPQKVLTQDDFCAMLHTVCGTRDVLSSRQFFSARTKESNTCASFCANAWTRARRESDRDPSSERFETVNAWTCTRQATDGDLESSSTMKKVNAWMCALLTTDHDPASVVPDMKREYVIFVFFADLLFCGINNRRNMFYVNFFYLRMVLELIYEFRLQSFSLGWWSRGKIQCSS